jgi:AraC-type DNA-binding domain-containing proteins
VGLLSLDESPDLPAFRYALWGMTENTVPNFTLFTPPRQDFFLMLCIRGGKGRLEQGQARWQLDAGSLVLLRFGLCSLLLADGGPVVFTSFCISGNCENFPTVCRPEPGSPLAAELDGLAREGRDAAPGAGFPELDDFFSGLAGGEYPAEPAVRQSSAYIRMLKQILDTRYAEPLNLDRLAQELHLGKFRLAKEFRRQYGIPPIKYLLNRRIQEACRLLCGTDLTVTGIGGRVGIGNTPYFIQIFKRTVGLTPLNYRKHFRQSATVQERKRKEREPPA